MSGSESAANAMATATGNIIDPATGESIINTMTSITKQTQQRIKLNVKVLGVQLGQARKMGWD